MSKRRTRPGLVRQVHDYFLPHERNSHKPHFFSAASIVVLLSFVLVLEGAYLAQVKVVIPNTGFLASVLPASLIALANQDRAANDIPAVTEDPQLDTAAQMKADDMAAKGYFSHVTPDGKQPWYWLDQVGYQYSYAGENLAVNFTDSKDVETAWMNSPTHRANLMKPQYTKVGIGVAHGTYQGREATFVVQFFAAAASAPTKVAVAATAAAPVAGAPVATVSVEPAASASSSKVLGTETTPPAVQASAPSGQLATLVTSPTHALQYLLALLLAVTLAVLGYAVLRRVHVAHPGIIAASALLVVVFAGAALFNSTLELRVHLPTDTQSASVINAF